MNSRTWTLSFALLFSSGLLVNAAIAAERDRKDAPRVASTPDRSKSDYVLQPLDVLRVHVFQEDDLNKQMEAVSISGEYTINLPLINTINLRGKTVRQAEDLIRAAFDKDFLVNPQVTVNVAKYSERSVNVIGAVNSAGRIQFPQESGLTIVDAISLAGGPNRYADLKKVKLTRKRPDGEPDVREINVDAMMKPGAGDAVVLEKDDVIFVPERII